MGNGDSCILNFQNVLDARITGRATMLWQAPVGFWDPAGFTADGSTENFARRRQTELKHGRISMLATWSTCGNIFVFSLLSTWSALEPSFCIPLYPGFEFEQ